MTEFSKRAVSLGRTILTLLAACVVASVASAQTYPARPITLIIPFAAGGPSDILGRLAAEHLGRTLGQQIVVENVGGAGGTIGADRAAKAAPDGYTLFMHHSGLAASPALYANLKHDPATAFEPIGLINTGPMVLASRKTLDVGNARGLFDWLTANGDKVTIAHAGIGSNSYMCSMLLMQVTGARLTMVPYRGTGPAMNDLVGGQIDILCDQATTATPQVTSGTIKAYAVTSTDRIAALPEVPSSREAGLGGFAMTIWNGLYAPAGTPQSVRDKLHAALQAFMDDPQVIERFHQTGTVAFDKTMRSPEQHRRFFDSEIAAYKKLMRAAGQSQIEAK